MTYKNSENFSIIVISTVYSKCAICQGQISKFIGFMDKSILIGGTQFSKSQSFKFHNFSFTHDMGLKFEPDLDYYNLF